VEACTGEAVKNDAAVAVPDDDGDAEDELDFVSFGDSIDMNTE
jgi:hypothetical protein